MKTSEARRAEAANTKRGIIKNENIAMKMDQTVTINGPRDETTMNELIGILQARTKTEAADIAAGSRRKQHRMMKENASLAGAKRKL
jgi:hypothetical protein